jgi:hypothetical protein
MAMVHVAMEPSHSAPAQAMQQATVLRPTALV